INNVSNVVLSNRGVLGQRQKARLYLDPYNDAGHGFYGEQSRHEVVRCITLEDIFIQYNVKHCDFLKIDCEGAEHDILSATPLDVFRKISRIVLEYHKVEHGCEGVKPLIVLLSRRGFRVSVVPSKDEPGRGMLYAVRRAKAISR
ncbi:MAG: FkbM family methyltransferase, partial [Candidatus Omnitrophota bacterium]